MSPLAAGNTAEVLRSGAALPAAKSGGIRPRRIYRSGSDVRRSSSRPTPLAYDSPVSLPVLPMHDEPDPAAEEPLLDLPADDADLPILRSLSGDAVEAGADTPASADDPVAPGSRVTLFEQAVEQNSRRLLAIARAIVGYRASPEDVVQQAIMNLYKHRARYDWRKPGGLLKRAVVNEALRLLRPPKMTMVADDHPAAFRAPSSDMETSETVRKVREAIDQLPEHFRAALVLCEYEQMSYAQIAETLDASIPQIKTWLHRARRKLATMLEPYMAHRNVS